VLISGAGILRVDDVEFQVAPADHPAGTTWVWDDGSGVVLKAEEKAQEEIEQRKAEQKEEVRQVYQSQSCLCILPGSRRPVKYCSLQPEDEA